jgi:hypothetical protein
MMEGAPHAETRDRLRVDEQRMCPFGIKVTYAVARSPPNAPAIDAADT